MALAIRSIGLTILLLLLLLPSLSAQNNRTSPTPLHRAHLRSADFERLTIEHGLPNNMVTAILQDSRGFLWFGTRDGLARYDGREFKVYKHDLYESSTISDNFVTVIHEDNSQRLWIGTSSGLNEFNCHTEQFTRYYPNSESAALRRVNQITAICEDRSGTLWIGVYADIGGVFRFDRQKKSFIAYRHNPHNPNSLSSNGVRNIIADDSGNLWIGTQQSGLNRFDTQTETFIHYMPAPEDPTSLSSPQVWYSLKDAGANLWFSVPNEGICRYDPDIDGFIRYRHDPNNPNSLRSNNAFAMFQDCRGFIWVANGLLSRLDPHSGSFVHFAIHPNNQKSVGSSNLSCMYEDRSHNLWVGTYSSGVLKLNLKPRQFTQYKRRVDAPNSLPASNIKYIHEDRDGLLWIGTAGSGVVRFDPSSEVFTHLPLDPENQTDHSGNNTVAIEEDHHGKIWVGTFGGLFEIDPRSLQHRQYRLPPQNDPHDPDNTAANSVHAILEDRFGTLWFGTRSGGLNKVDRSTGKVITYKPRPEATVLDWYNDVLDIHEDRFGNLWMTTHRQLLLFDRQLERFTVFRDEASQSDRFGSLLFEDCNGTIWSIDSGLKRADTQSKTFKRYGFNFAKGPEKGINAMGGGLYWIHEDSTGMLWCGSPNGLFKFDPNQEQVVAHYSTRNGLLSNVVYKIIEDDDGSLWLLHPSGITVFRESEPEVFCKQIGVKDGIVNASTSLHAGAFMKTRSGEIYWGGTNGIYRFHTGVQETNAHPPPVQLTEFRLIDGKTTIDSTITEINMLDLSHHQNYFSFEFAALDFTSPKQNQYAYKLEGLDNNWVEVGNRNHAHYTNVPPGEYTFRVKASNNDGVWNEAGASVKIIISPPFWHTWWFRLSVILAIVAVVYAGHRYRVTKLLEVERTRNRIARDLHDEVGSSLSSIALTAELLQKELATNGLVSRQLKRVHQTAEKLTRTLKEIVWAIDPQRDRLDDLLLHMHETADEMLRQSDIDYDIHAPQDQLPKTLAMEVRRNVMMIFKELLHNIIKHSRASHVDLLLHYGNGILELRVADDGIGFNTEEEIDGHGLANIRQRTAEIGGEVAFHSRKQQGTVTRLRVRIS